MSRHMQSIAFVVLFLATCTSWAEIGTVQFTIGDVRLQTARGAVQAAKGTPINEGDTIVVGSGTAHLKMVDGGIIALRPDTQMKFDQYKWNGREDGSENGLLSLAKGGFRTITGAIGRANKENLKIITPTATVGIRGTDHEVVYVPEGTLSIAPAPIIVASAISMQSDGEPLLIGQLDTLVPTMLAQVGTAGAGAFAGSTLNKVNSGGTTVRNNFSGN